MRNLVPSVSPRKRQRAKVTMAFDSLPGRRVESVAVDCHVENLHMRNLSAVDLLMARGNVIRGWWG